MWLYLQVALFTVNGNCNAGVAARRIDIGRPTHKLESNNVMQMCIGELVDNLSILYSFHLDFYCMDAPMWGEVVQPYLAHR